MHARRISKNMKKGWPAKSATREARKGTSAANGSDASAAKTKSPSGKTFSKVLNQLFDHERWPEARALIEKELAHDPDSHWLRARLSTTYYEERNYAWALEEIERAYRQASNCPLVLWDYAGTLDALGRTAEAIEIYSRLLGKGVEAVAYEECGEGIRWAIGLLTDCWYRLGVCHEHLGNAAVAAKHYLVYLVLRTSQKAHSIYSLEEVLKRIGRLTTPPNGSSAQRFEETKKELQRSLLLG
jgi:tetratricopeptide (TPR) repeat protein